jgi:hypothetical protein
MNAAAHMVGDWTQAREIIREDHGPLKGHVHARVGGVGHVLEVLEDGWLNVYWERAGSISICHESEVSRLCGAGVGR